MTLPPRRFPDSRLSTWPTGAVYGPGCYGEAGAMTFSRLIRSSELTAVGQDSRRLSHEVSSARLVRVRHGVYFDGTHCSQMDDWARYGARAAALNGSAQTPPVYSLQTAGLLWGLWLVGCPENLHAVTAFKNGGRSKPGVKRHIGALDADVTTLFGFRATDKARTAVELIARLPFAHAVAVADSSRRTQVDDPDRASLDWKRDHPVGPSLGLDELHAVIGLLSSNTQKHRATTVLNFSSDLSDPPANRSAAPTCIFLASLHPNFSTHSP